MNPKNARRGAPSFRFYLTGTVVGLIALLFALWLTGNLPFFLKTAPVSVASPDPVSHASDSSSQAPGPGSNLKTIPAFALKTSADHLWKSENGLGKKLIVHFWAAWCPPCLEEIQQLVSAARGFERLNPEFLFVLISLDANWEDAHKVLPSDQLPGNMVSLLDPEKKVAEQFGSFNYPETYLVDERGGRLTKLVGPQDWADDEIVESIKSVFKNR